LGDTDIILARPAQDNAFAFAPVEVLRGTGPAEPLPHLVDSVMRRKMALYPKHAVLFGRNPEGDWQRISYVNEDYRSVIDRVLGNASDWGNGFGQERFSLFASLIDHPDAAIRYLALREVDKAPYEMLRQMDSALSSQELLAEMWTREGYPFQSIRVLLLGLTGEDSARTEVQDFFDRTRGWDYARNLGAFATALVELDGVDGLARLETTLLEDSTQQLDKLEQVVEALAIQNGVGTPGLRNAIRKTLATLVERRPEAAILVARHFSNRNDWSQGRTLNLVMQQRTVQNPSDQFAIASYVNRAQRQSNPAD
ncbi:MAG: hypothetical protein ABJ349_16340, partial [Hyphomicrobiales bacterium]